MDESGFETAETTLGWTPESPDIRDQIERLGQHFQELYNENSLLRARVRSLERELGRESPGS